MSRMLCRRNGPCRPLGITGRLLVAGLVLAGVGCGGGDGPGPSTPQPTTITVDPAVKRLLVGNQIRLTATVLDENGQPMAGQTVNWTSSNENIALVDASGNVTATGGGQATINARTPRTTGGNVTGTAQINVPTPDGMVGPGGGQVPDGASATVLQVPAGALGANTTITIVPAPEPGGSIPSDPSPGIIVPGTVFELGPEGTQFAPAATLTIGYNPASLPGNTSEGGLKMYRSTGTSSWTLIGGSVVDTDARVVRAPVTGFSIYALVAKPNGTPTPTITQPADNSTVQRGQSVTFQGSASDPEDGTLTGSSLVWTSSIDDQIGTGTSFSTSSLSEGVHTITLTATDSEGATGTAEVTLTVEAPAQLVTVSLGQTSSSTIQVGDQLILPIQLDMTQANGLEVARLELRLSFSLTMFGAVSWSVGGVDFIVLGDETEIDGSTPIARAVFTRDADFGSSATVGLLAVDAAAAGSGTISVGILEAYDQNDQPITALASDNHQVTINASNPPVQMLLPGTAVGNAGGGVIYFRVPVPASAAGAGAAPAGAAASALFSGGDGAVKTPGGRGATSIPGPFETLAPSDLLQVEPAHVRVLTRVLDDARSPKPAPAAAAGQTLRIQTSGGTGDADLYVRYGALPTVNTFDCRPFTDGNEETCDAVDPAGGDWYIMLRQFGFTQFANVELSIFLFDAVTITTTVLPDAVVGVAYNAALQAENGDGTYEWSVVSGDLPPGITLDPDGTLSGTPTSAGEFTFGVQVASAGKLAEMEYTITVSAGTMPMAYVFARNQSDASYTPNAVDFENLAGGSVQITRTAVGQYDVAFGGMGVGTLGSAFTVMVNAVADNNNDVLTKGGPVCRLNNLHAGAPVTASVVCEDPTTGGATDARYRVLVVGDNVLGPKAAFSLHNNLGGSSYTPNALFSWNSDGGAQTVAPQGSGVVQHTMGTNMSPPWSAFVSTQDVGNGGAGNVCTISGGNNTDLLVKCFARTGGAYERAHFALQMQKGRPDAPWAYAYVVDGSLNPTFSATTGGAIDVTTQGTGRWRVTFNGIDLTATPAIMVTPVLSSSWAACSHFRSGSSPITVDVACYNTSGNFIDQSFFVTVIR